MLSTFVEVVQNREVLPSPVSIKENNGFHEQFCGETESVEMTSPSTFDAYTKVDDDFCLSALRIQPATLAMLNAGSLNASSPTH